MPAPFCCSHEQSATVSVGKRFVGEMCCRRLLTMSTLHEFATYCQRRPSLLGISLLPCGVGRFAFIRTTRHTAGNANPWWVNGGVFQAYSDTSMQNANDNRIRTIIWLVCYPAPGLLGQDPDLKKNDKNGADEDDGKGKNHQAQSSTKAQKKR